jgi:hypothetical protein
MKERNQYAERYDVMSPVERMREMRNIYSYIPHVNTFIKPPEEITREERAKRYERFPEIIRESFNLNSLLEVLERTRSEDLEEHRRVHSAMEQREESQLKGILAERLGVLGQYLHFTSSGQRYVVTSFETIFVTGIDLDAKSDPSPSRDIFGILYKWKDGGDGGPFNKDKAQELERIAYTNAIQTQLFKKRLEEEMGSNEIIGFFRELGATLGEDMSEDEIRELESELQGQDMKQFLEKLEKAAVKEGVKEGELEELIKDWRNEYIEKYGVEP